MIQKDLLNRLAHKQVLQPTRQTNSDAPFVGAIQDMADLIGFTYVIELGQLTDVGFTTVVLLEHGDVANLSTQPPCPTRSCSRAAPVRRPRQPSPRPTTPR